MKNNWYKWSLYVWLFLLTITIFALIAKTQEIAEEQKAQKEILVKQTEIIALNTMMLRALILPEHDIIEELE